MRIVFILAVLLATGCRTDESGSDAFGNFEAVDVQVSAEVSGRLLSFSPREGKSFQAGQVVGQVDTTQAALRRDQLHSQRRAVQARIPGVNAEADVLRAQLLVVQREESRIHGLRQDGAATSKQLDDVVGQVEVLKSQVDAVLARRAPILAELMVIDDQLAQVEDQITRARITNPVSGTVLATFAEPSELAVAGRPLYRLAPLDTLELRAYISGSQLPDVGIGQQVTVLADAGSTGELEFRGRVSWIASEAEFTPKMIQTKEERVDLMYAFKVRVPNPDGYLKVGMPGEVVLNTEAD